MKNFVCLIVVVFLFSCNGDNVPDCFQNSGSIVQQEFVVDFFEMRFKDNTHKSLEVSIRAETLDHDWVNLKFYGLEVDISIDKFNKKVQNLINAWKGVNE